MELILSKKVHGIKISGNAWTRVPQQLKSVDLFAIKQGIKEEVALQFHLVAALVLQDLKSVGLVAGR